MESSDVTSSDQDSSCSSDAPLMYQPTPATMHVPQRSEMEKKMIDDAINSLLNTFDRFRPQLSQAQYAYFCESGTKYLNGVMDKKTRKLNRSYMDSTACKSDLASVAGSVRHGNTGPLYQCYPYNIPSAQRPPTAASSFIGDYPRQPAFESLAHRFMQSEGHSSGYSSGVQSHGMESYYNRAGLNEAYDAQSFRQQPPVFRLRGGRELSVIKETPASPSSRGSNEDHSIDEAVRENTMRLAVPKRTNGVVELKNWVLKLVKEDLVVTGTTRDRAQVTSGAVTRYSHPAIITSKGSYQVFGQPAFGDRTPAFVKSACGNGFPRQWKWLCLKWLSERQARRKSTPKKTPERKNTNKNNSAKKVKPPSAASKPSSNTSSKLKTSKSSSTQKSDNKLQKKNRLSPDSQSDKENKTAKRRSRSLVRAKTSQAKKRSLTCDENKPDEESPVLASKQSKTKMKSRPNLVDESEEDSPVPAPKQSKTKVKSRSKPDEGSEKDSPVPAPKQSKTKVKSRSKPDETLTMANKKNPSNANKQPTTVPSYPLPTNATVDIQKQPRAKQQEKAAAKQLDKKGKDKQEDKKGKGKQEDRREAKATKSQGTSKKTGGGIFGDSPVGNAAYEDAFAELGGDHLFNIPYSRSMTPNTLVASIQPDAGTIGRYTPPIQNVQHLFPALRPNQTFNSSYGSPSSLNSSRDNPVSRRVAKDVAAASKIVGKKKRKIPETEEAPRELADLVKSLHNPNPGFRTPTIVKKVFRNQRDSEEDESESEEEEESMAY